MDSVSLGFRYILCNILRVFIKPSSISNYTATNALGHLLLIGIAKVSLELDDLCCFLFFVVVDLQPPFLTDCRRSNSKCNRRWSASGSCRFASRSCRISASRPVRPRPERASRKTNKQANKWNQQTKTRRRANQRNRSCPFLFFFLSPPPLYFPPGQILAEYTRLLNLSPRFTLFLPSFTFNRVQGLEIY